MSLISGFVYVGALGGAPTDGSPATVAVAATRPASKGRKKRVRGMTMVLTWAGRSRDVQVRKKVIDHISAVGSDSK
ncbi:hypothetical protein GCM10009742_52350 [Kribbella karoonensis]|uniref:Uncharacterized protein n=1 Tax=Kribbella karoonensis TaxID=324851 RepID=A0ABN2EB01_9ACTN